jgi:hypothetical protein
MKHRVKRPDCDALLLETFRNDGKSSPVTGLEWPRGFQEVKVPRFLDNVTVWW